MKAEIVKFGTMYFDGSPADPGARFDKKTLSIGGTLPGWELPWVKDGDRLIADRCICTTVSWHQLDCWGFVFGKLVYIDRNPYVCRCLRVGNTEEEPCEWTELMDKYGDDDGLWHWDGRFSGDRRPLGKMAQPNWSVPQEVFTRPMIGTASTHGNSYTSSDFGPCWSL